MSALYSGEVGPSYHPQVWASGLFSAALREAGQAAITPAEFCLQERKLRQESQSALGADKQAPDWTGPPLLAVNV